MAAWPSNFPLPNIEGYSLNPQDPVIRTDMEAGNTLARRRTAVKRDRVTVSVRLSRVQFVEFEQWFYSSSEADGGAAWFDIKLLTGSRSAPSTVTARFSSIWSATPDSFSWTVTMPLEVRYA